MKYLVGFFLGVIVSTVGFSTVSKVLDNGVDKIKQTVNEYAR